MHQTRTNRIVMTGMLLLGAAFATDTLAQQGLAADLTSPTSSARITTLPTEPGKLETYFINIKNGDVVASPFRVIFGVTGFGIAPAGVNKEDTGHHHLLVDSTLPADLSKPIPFSEKYAHFGKGQTETVLDLPPGKHTLQLLFADHEHKPMFKTKWGNMVVVHSRKIEITVIDPAAKSKAITTASFTKAP